MSIRVASDEPNVIRAALRLIVPEPLRRWIHFIRWGLRRPLPLVVAPWTYWARRDDAMSQLHRLASELVVAKQARSLETRLERGLVACLWPLAAMRKGWTMARSKQGAIACSNGAGPWWFQVLEQGWLATRHHVTPESYYKYAFYRRNRADVSAFVQLHECCELYPYVRVMPQADIIKKRLFWKFCRSHDLPGIPVIAVVEREQFGFKDGYTSLPDLDLFVKSDGWWGGLGTNCWTFDARAKVWSDEDRRYDARQLVAYLQSTKGERPKVVQPRVRNAASMTRWSARGLCTIRMMTFWDGDELEVVAASLRMPLGDAYVDNLTSGGLVASIDLETGVLSTAVKMSGERLLRHPTTGESIAGERTPCWAEVRRLAERAHAASGYPGFVGWDIAITEQGVVLVEANLTPGGDLHQMPSGKPLGAAGFAEKYMRLFEHPAVVDEFERRRLDAKAGKS